MSEGKKTVFLLGSKGIPASYGGFETFVEQLTLNRIDGSIQYYVSCLAPPGGGAGEPYEHNGATCFPVRAPDIGPARAVYYDWMSLRWALRHIRESKTRNAVVLLCACRIGPFVAASARRLHRLGARLVVNPDGHEWKRAKWNAAVKAYWRFSERLCVRHADLIVCDSQGIERYVKEKYRRFRPKTAFIAYGSETSRSPLADDDPRVAGWYERWGVRKGQYYVNIARLTPENNYETIIREFMASGTDKDLVIAASLTGGRFERGLEERLHYRGDRRIKLVGGIYDQGLLKKVRENAYGYIHGHSVGGTNPSLLEALGTLDLCLLYDCEFNSEVAGDGALYWNLERGSLRALIERADAMPPGEVRALGDRAHRRIRERYTWESVCGEYEAVFRRLASGDG